MLDAQGNALLVELEFMCFNLVHKGQVQGEAHNIALNSIITFIVIIINDHELTILKRGRDVLEILIVKWIRQDVIRMATLEGAALGHLGA